MRDPLSKVERSKRMALVRSENTQPELRVRSLLKALGYRYSMHVRTLPGCPDIVFKSRRKVIFIHGCFWHRHNCARGNRLPKTRVGFWRAKLEGNRMRDRKIAGKLKRTNWQVLNVWECQTTARRLAALEARVRRFMEESRC